MTPQEALAAFRELVRQPVPDPPPPAYCKQWDEVLDAMFSGPAEVFDLSKLPEAPVSPEQQAAAEGAQEIVRKIIRPGVSLVDELIAERRAAAAAE
jgi:hypothetical protein